MTREELAEKYIEPFYSELSIEGYGCPDLKDAYLAGYDARESEIDELKNHIGEHGCDVVRLKQQNEELKSALRFYADEKNWMVTREDGLHVARMTIIGDPDSFGMPDGSLLVIGGKLARETLKKVGEG